MWTSACSLFALGCPVNFEGSWASAEPRQVVHLPTYTFQREKHWLEAGKTGFTSAIAAPVTASASASASASAAGLSAPAPVAGASSSTINVPSAVPAGPDFVCPILGNMNTSATNDEVVFSSRYNVVNLPLLGDHVLHDVVVVPGAAYLSMIITGMQHIHGAGPFQLKNIVFPQALVIHEPELGCKLNLHFDSAESQASITVFSTPAPAPSVGAAAASAQEWTKRCFGEVDAEPSSVPSARLPAGYAQEVQARCPRTVSPADFYDVLWNREYHLRHAFRWVGPANAGQQESICRMRLPAYAHEHVDMALPPGLIDSCFQLLSATAFDDYKGTTFIPLGIDSLFFYKKPEDFADVPLWCHTKERR
jgi:acyl transferase domain-containing protein